MARLLFIKSRRVLGFSLADVSGLLRSAGPGTAACGSACDAAAAQLLAVRDKIAALHRIEAELINQISLCSWSCGDRNGQDCSLILPLG